LPHSPVPKLEAIDQDANTTKLTIGLEGLSLTLATPSYQIAFIGCSNIQTIVTVYTHTNIVTIDVCYLIQLINIYYYIYFLFYVFFFKKGKIGKFEGSRFDSECGF